ncbi:ClC family H(+)/Cl(-) exchange transporter [Clostridium paraputrificum]|uniref:ClC family H(+)/Cl(-) exchange transporter n=1 Tax=Clostridium paraputrificum TaxID=29363 RepID=UPI003D356D89
MSVDKDEIISIMSHRKNLKFKLVLESLLIGIIVGGIIVLNRLLINKLTPYFMKLYKGVEGNVFDYIKVFGILVLVGLFVGFLVKREPMISGSGIPQVEGILMKSLSINWLKVLIYKFVGGTLSLATGLSVGREGPSVQIGAAVGQGFSKVCRRINIEEKFLITSGASAGLSAAFNAPISGVIFALEEVHKNFSPLVLLSAMAASLAADFVCKQFLGVAPAMEFTGVNMFPLKYYWSLLLLGILVGITGIIFNKGILASQKIYEIFKKIPTEIKMVVPFICAGLVGILTPILLGGGHELIMSLVTKGFTIKILLFFLIIKYIFTLISFGSGAPGGIFFPLLVLGALVGNIYGIFISDFFGLPKEFIVNFIILAMAGHFASIVKAPITGIILITEMTGSFEHLLALAFVVIISYLTADIFKSRPIYDSLLERILMKGNNSTKAYRGSKTLLEKCVCMGSYAEGRYVSEVKWPKNSLLVSIKRGDREIIPKGDTKIDSGDFLVLLINENNAREALVEIDKLASKVY